jgi:ATP synthase protein I
MRPSPWVGAGEGWNVVSELIAATVVWGAVGYGLDRWWGTGPVLMVIGGLIGHAAGIYLIIHRSRMKLQRENERRRGAT